MNRPYSEATVDLVKRAAWKLWDDPDTRPAMPVYDGGLERILGAALDALAAAGLLLPEGVETRTEWAVRNGLVLSHCRSRERAEHWLDITGVGEVVSRTVTTSPWDAVRLAVGDSKPTGQDPSVSVEETPQ